MISLKLDETFGNDTIFVSEFLRAVHKWAPIFCDNWEYQLDAAQQKVEFFRTTRSYRNAVLKESGPGASAAIENATTSRYSNAATLRGKTQDQSSQEEKPMDNKSKGHGAKDNNPLGKGARKCVGGDIPEFKECPYIVPSIRTSDWKEVKKMGDLIRQ
jgi:hypothetical protein